MKKIIVFLCLLGLTVPAGAQIGSSLLIPRDAEEIGIRQSISSEALDGETLSTGATYGLWAPQASNSNLLSASAAMNFLDKFSARLELAHISDRQSGMLYNENGAPLGEYKGSELLLEAGAAMKVLPSLALGLNLKMLNYNLSSELKGNAFAADLSACYALKDWRFDLGVENFGLSGLSSASAGASYAKAMFKAVAEVDYYFAGAFSAAVGAEVNYRQLAFFRAGYHLGSQSPALPSYASVGTGVKFKGFQLDLAYLLGSSTISGTLLFTIKYTL